ncbi:MAG: FAD-dependent oxidoreductase [Candidatus Ratteibacteria bacterium]
MVHQVYAKILIDCSGDAIFAPLTGALYRMGREARNEFNESHAPENADSKTMGMSCMFMAREYETAQKFEPPSYAYRFETCDQLPYGKQGHSWFEMGYWWIELGGEYHSIYDTEKLRDELMKIVLGVWDHIKTGVP